MHYDEHRFPNAVLYVEGVKGLLPASSSGDGWFTDVVRELSADNPFGPPNDDFLDHHMRGLGTYETYGTGLGNGFRIFAWPTETEHFNYARYLLEEVHEPVAPGVIDGIAQYVGRQHVNGKGPRPEAFIAFLRELEAARSSGQRLVLMGHYPPFYAGEGPDQTPDSADALRGDAAWAVRMASWYYRRPNGEAVMPLAVSGHVHHYGESDFRFRFENAAEESRFRTELGRILQRKSAASIYDDLHHLRHDWDLDNRIEIRRVQDPGSDRFARSDHEGFQRELGLLLPTARHGLRESPGPRHPLGERERLSHPHDESERARGDAAPVLPAGPRRTSRPSPRDRSGEFPARALERGPGLGRLPRDGPVRGPRPTDGRDDLRARIGLDWGLPTTYFTVNRVTSGNPAYGGEIYLHGIFPHMGLTVWGESTKDADWAAGLGLRLTLPLVTYRLPSGTHPHH
jgi:hypothetical protein